MPIPFLHYTDDQLFPVLNLVLLGYFCLVFLPRWRYTSNITLMLVIFYSLCYILLLIHRMTISTVPTPPISFDTLDDIVALFKDRGTVFAGWDHYIAFDLFVARWLVLDSQERHIPHLCVVPFVPLTLMAGPAGLALYLCLVVPMFAWWCDNTTTTNNNNNKKKKKSE